MCERLLGASRRWAATQPTVTVLVAAGGSDGVPEDTLPLLAAWRELGLRVVLAPWQTAEAPLSLALPLGTWDYDSARDTFAARLRALRAGGTGPAADLEAVAWHSHKAYLLEVADAVPTRLLRRGSGAAALASAVEELGSPELIVAKPAVGSRGDGVERLVAAEGCPAWLAELLQTHDFLVQPFLAGVARRGEVCLVFINGEFLHAAHKDPAGWGPADAEASLDEPAPAPGAGLARHACARQCVRLLQPPEAEMLALASRTMEWVARRCGGAPYLARVDLLPADDGRSWLVSELELGWPELFLRADPSAVPRVAAGLLRHLPPTSAPPRASGTKRPLDEEEEPMEAPSGTGAPPATLPVTRSSAPACGEAQGGREVVS